MSLVSKLFNSNRSQYLLDIEESGAPEIKRAQRSGVIGSISKRIFGGVLIAAVGFSALAAGFMTYSAAAPQARADWISDIVCTSGLTAVPDDDKLATIKWQAYSGYSNNMKQASFGALSPVGLEQLFSAVTARHYADTPGDYTSKNYDNTAYEVYGGFFPFFDAWYGAYDHDGGDTYFLGTNGQAGTSTDKDSAHYKWATGSPVKLNEEQTASSSLYSHNFLECGDLVKTGVVNLSNIVFFPAKVLVVVTNSVLGWSLSLSNDDPGNPIVLIQKAISQLIIGEPGAQNGLKDQLYLSFLPPVLMIATFGLLYQGVVRGRARGAFGAGLWMLLATITGFLFVNNPMVIPGGMNNLVQTVTSALSGAIINTQAPSASVLQERANGKYAAATVADMCMVKGNNGDYAYSYSVADNGTVKQTGTSPQNYIRQTQCAIWKGMIYEPWVNGQFGLAASSSNAVLTRDPRKILSKTTVQLGNATYVGNAPKGQNDLNWPLYELVAQAQGEVTFKAGGATSTFDLGTNNLSEVAFAQLTDTRSLEKSGEEWIIPVKDGKQDRYTGKWAVNGMWAGGNLDRQTGAAMLSFFGSLVVTLYVMVSAITIIGLQFSTLFLIAISPFFFLLGVAPGWGRRVLMRWFELIMEIVIKRIMIVFVLALYIKFFDIIVNLPLPYLFRILALGIISFVALFQRNRITKIFTDQLKFGGNEKILDGSFQKKAKQTAKTAGVVAAAGGIAVLTAGAGTPIAAGMVSSTGLVAGAGAAAGAASKAAGAKKAVQGAAGAANGAKAAAGAAPGAKAEAGAASSASATAQVNVQKKDKTNEDRIHDKKSLELTEAALKERQDKGAKSSPELDKKRQELEGVQGQIEAFKKKNPAPKGSDAYFAEIKAGKTEKDSKIVSDHKSARKAWGEKIAPLSQRESALKDEIFVLENAGDPATDSEADALFGPVPVSNGPVAPSAGASREIPRGRLQQIPNTVDIDAANAAVKRNARLKAAREAMVKAAASGGKLNPQTILTAVDKGRDAREFAVAQQMGQINQQAAMVSANDAEERDIIRLEEAVRANDIAAQQQAGEQQRHIERMQAALDASEAQAQRDAENAKTQDQIRRTTNRIDRKLNGPRDAADAKPQNQANRIDRKLNGPRDSGLGGGSGPRFPRKE